MPIVDGEKLVGVVTDRDIAVRLVADLVAQADVARHADSSRTGEVVEEISS